MYVKHTYAYVYTNYAILDIPYIMRNWSVANSDDITGITYILIIRPNITRYVIFDKRNLCLLTKIINIMT